MAEHNVPLRVVKAAYVILDRDDNIIAVTTKENVAEQMAEEEGSSYKAVPLISNANEFRHIQE